MFRERQQFDSNRPNTGVQLLDACEAVNKSRIPEYSVHENYARIVEKQKSESCERKSQLSPVAE